MNLRKVAGIVLILVITGLFWNGYADFISTQKSNSAEKQLAKTKINPEKKLVYYKLINKGFGKSIAASVYIKDRKIITFDQVAGGITPRQRALIVVNKLGNFVKNNKNPWEIFPDFKNGIAVIKYGNETLFTADVKSAKSNGLKVSDLAFNWANNVRKALGAPTLIKDYELIEKIANNNKSNKSVGYNAVGVASWYGGYFHGRTAADGSIYNMYKFTAAHKSLPFGSVVKVTNLRNGDSCLVKITDRGPYVNGRIIDLSRVAAKEIGMLKSGISKVKIEVIGRV